MANENDTGADNASVAAASAAAVNAEAAAAQVAEAGEPAAETAPVVQTQTVPIERFRAVIGQRAEREAQLLQARRELDLANATIEEFKKLSEGATAAAQGDQGAAAASARAASARVPTPAEIETLVAQEAARRDFTRQCNEAFTAGKSAHTDFEKVIGDLNALSPVFDPRMQRPVMPQSLVEAALATGNAHEVLYALGKDNSLADRVLSMTPLQQAAELTKLSMKLEVSGEAAAAAVASASKAPPPVRPKVTGSGSSAPVWDPTDTERFTTQEWIAKREADLKRARESTRH